MRLTLSIADHAVANSFATPIGTLAKPNTLSNLIQTILRGDTVFQTDSIYVDRWHTLSHHDTITLLVRDSIPYPVEISGQSEPSDPVPRFYRISTIAFWLFLLGLILVLAAYGILRRAFRLGR